MRLLALVVGFGVALGPAGFAGNPPAPMANPSSAEQHANHEDGGRDQRDSCEMPVPLPCCAASMSCSLMLGASVSAQISVEAQAWFSTVGEGKAQLSPVITLDPPPPRV